MRFWYLIFILLWFFSNQIYAKQNTTHSTTAFADLLYWRMREGSTENWAQVITPAGANQSDTLIDAPFRWNTGLRIGVNYKQEQTFDSTIYYTGYQSKALNHASGRVFSAFLGNFFANNTNGANFGPFYQSANVQWRIAYNTLDFDLGKKFDVTPILTVRPFLGLKGASINQTISSNWEGPMTTVLGVDTPITTFSTATETLKNNFWGIGPTLGLNTTWSLYKNEKTSFNVLGNFSAALLRGEWSFRDVYENNTPAAININTTNLVGLAPMAGTFIGMEWSHQLPKADMGIRLGYEAQVWFNQLQFYSYNMGRLNNLMSLQGGTLEFRINY